MSSALLLDASFLSLRVSDQLVTLTYLRQAPAYAIYENGIATRVVLINYVSDPSGANDFNATLTGQSSEQVYVR